MRKKQTDRERDSNRERDREIEIVLTIRERIGDSEIFFHSDRHNRHMVSISTYVCILF